MTQHEEIIRYITKNGSITALEAFSEIGCTKLASRVSELIKTGVTIEKQEVRGTNRNGKPIRYMRYSFPKTK